MPEQNSIAFLAFSPQGVTLGKKLARDMEGELFVPARLWEELEDGGEARAFDSLAGWMAENFHSFGAHVFIGAAGIAVRAIAPHLQGKTVDPAVVVCEIHGRFVISLLSGHMGGANALARNLAERTGGQSVVTTATDSEGLPALDVLADIAHCRIADPAALKLVTAVLLAGRKPALLDPDHILDLSDTDRALLFQEMNEVPRSSDGANAPAVVAGIRAMPPAPGRLRLFARRLHVGLGYRMGTPAETLLEALRTALADAGLAVQAVADIASSDIKADDPAIREVARVLDVPFRFFAAAELAAVPVPNPSDKAAEVLGVGPVSVSEGSALLAAPTGSRLILPKRILDGVTVAVACPAVLSSCGAHHAHQAYHE